MKPELEKQLAFLVPWLERMQSPRVGDRPTAREALSELRKVIDSLSDEVLRTPLWPKFMWKHEEKVQVLPYP